MTAHDPDIVRVARLALAMREKHVERSDIEAILDALNAAGVVLVRRKAMHVVRADGVLRSVAESTVTWAIGDVKQDQPRFRGSRIFRDALERRIFNALRAYNGKTAHPDGVPFDER